MDKIGRSDVFFSASDFPHEMKAEYPEKIEDFMARTDLPEGAHRDVLWNAPLRMYALDEAEVARATA
jgi:hypothetical protein